MKSKRTDLIWGGLLVLFGALFLAQNVGLIPDLAPLLWAAVFAGAGVLFTIVYFNHGWQAWWWLFPALGGGAIAVIIFLAEIGLDGPFLGTLLLWAAAIPFGVAYLSDRKSNWWALIPMWATAVIGFVVMLSEVAPGELIGALIMFAIALPFLVVYIINRKYWWALIPAYATGVLGVVILFSSIAAGELIGALIMFAVALPFLVVYLRNRQHWWALIPAFATGVLGVIILPSTAASGELVGALFLFGIALPFFYVYFRVKGQWWALIPAGVLTSIALVALLSGVLDDSEFGGRLLGVILFLGWAVTFGWLWLQRGHRPTEWARYPAAGLVLVALFVLLLGDRWELIWSVALIAVGGWMLLDNLRQPKLKG